MNAPANDWRIAQAEKIRAVMGADFCAVADALRETFAGTKLTWLDTPTIKTGTPPEGEPIGESWNRIRHDQEAA